MKTYKQESFSFAGFVMTYNRPKILLESIREIFKQSLSPEILLIIDNSENNYTKYAIEKLNNPKIKYIKMPENIGPAGAANRGVKFLSELGYDWIYWGDDDDPPKFPNIFINLVEIASKNENTGAIGSVGSKFDFKNGLTVRFKDEELKGVLSADTIGGGHNLILNGEAIRKTGVLPDPKLFFGFEEFDFLQRLKKVGYSILVSGDSLFQHRKASNRLNYKINRKLIPKLDEAASKRKYYSYRNHIYIFYHKLGLKRLAILIIIRATMKVFMGYFNGFKFGNRNAIYTFSAIFDGLTKKLGKHE
ncbi:glycosyltransferase [Salegentibacter maritimus]|uniref:glycosyltransferase n=1 Tax=Salegentibacter maritimus TaxID=2794347 RepID=UPI0018E4D99A|nr:glycosyltransferase [Salegentibacter maritimus]MBI6117345.1 glycosyltransferase [Salegentibacter maritimus]